MPKIGCRTVAVSCNRDSEIGKEADLAIEPVPDQRSHGFHQAEGRNRPEDGSEYDIHRKHGGYRKVYEPDGGYCADKYEADTRAENIVTTATGCTRKKPGTAWRRRRKRKAGNHHDSAAMRCKIRKDKIKSSWGYVRNAIQDL